MSYLLGDTDHKTNKFYGACLFAIFHNPLLNNELFEVLTLYHNETNGEKVYFTFFAGL